MFFCDCQLISVKKLQLISRLHISEQSWFKTAEHCSLYLTSKVAMQFLFDFLTFSVLLAKTLNATDEFLNVSLVVQLHSDYGSDHPSVGHRGPEYHHGVY